MKTIDIRECDEEPVERIVFAKEGLRECCIDKDDLGVKEYIIGQDGEPLQCFEIDSLEEAENLIKALQKASELGWFK